MKEINNEPTWDKLFNKFITQLKGQMNTKVISILNRELLQHLDNQFWSEIDIKLDLELKNNL